MFFCAPVFCLTQENLVINGDFEIYDTCPDNTSQLERAIGWWNFQEYGGKSNYLNICSTHPFLTIPNNGIGFQFPQSGNAYIESELIFCQKPRNFSWWTGIQDSFVYGGSWFGGSLTRQLKPVPHYIEFYINFSKVGTDDGFGGGEPRLAVNAVDLIILNKKESLVTYSGVQFPYSDKIINVNKDWEVLDDTLNWVKLSTCFLPTGDELFFTIGAFRDTNNINLAFSGNHQANLYQAIYFFDNFSIYEYDTCCFGEFPYDDHVSISSNPGTDNNPTTFSVLINPNTSGVFSIFDSAGRLIEKHEITELLTTIILKKDLAVGVYQYELTTSNGVKDVGKILVNQ